MIWLEEYELPECQNLPKYPKNEKQRYELVQIMILHKSKSTYRQDVQVSPKEEEQRQCFKPQLYDRTTSPSYHPSPVPRKCFFMRQSQGSRQWCSLVRIRMTGSILPSRPRKVRRQRCHHSEWEFGLAVFSAVIGLL